MKPRMLIMALSIHFYDILSSLARFSMLLDVHALQFVFQAKPHGRDYSGILYILRIFRVHSQGP